MPRFSVLPPQKAQDYLYWLRLIRSENVGPITFFHLLERFGTAEKALLHLPELSAKGGRKRPLILASLHEVEDELDYYQKNNIQLLAYNTEAYPKLLSEIEDPPPLLIVKGQTSLLEKPCIAFVGARNASASGRYFTEQLVHHLGTQGFVIASGLARGIDTSAHQSSLKTGTIGVIASGINAFYPPENEALQKQMSEQGLVVTENKIGTLPQAQNFPRRNRLIAGLSYGVVVIEATLKSGSLITANYALDQNREIFAVPGSPLDPRSEGPNHLIQQGATLVKSADDILKALKALMGQKQFSESSKGTYTISQQNVSEDVIQEARKELCMLLSFVPISIDDLKSQTEIPLMVLKSVLLELELAGHLERHPGQKVSLLGETLLSQKPLSRG
jgi:DNA processing protein